MGAANDCKFYAKGVLQINSEKLCSGWARGSIARFSAHKLPQKRIEKRSEFIRKSDPKSMKITSGGTLEHQKAPTGEQTRIFNHFFLLKKRFLRGHAQSWFWALKSSSTASHKSLKKRTLQTHMFLSSFAISRTLGARFSSILGSKSDPRTPFFRRFSGDRFYLRFFTLFFVKKRVFHKL